MATIIAPSDLLSPRLKIAYAIGHALARAGVVAGQTAGASQLELISLAARMDDAQTRAVARGYQDALLGR